MLRLLLSIVLAWLCSAERIHETTFTSSHHTTARKEGAQQADKSGSDIRYSMALSEDYHSKLVGLDDPSVVAVACSSDMTRVTITHTGSLYDVRVGDVVTSTKWCHNTRTRSVLNPRKVLAVIEGSGTVELETESIALDVLVKDLDVSLHHVVAPSAPIQRVGEATIYRGHQKSAEEIFRDMKEESEKDLITEGEDFFGEEKFGFPDPLGLGDKAKQVFGGVVDKGQKVLRKVKKIVGGLIGGAWGLIKGIGEGAVALVKGAIDLVGFLVTGKLEKYIDKELVPKFGWNMDKKPIVLFPEAASPGDRNKIECQGCFLGFEGVKLEIALLMKDYKPQDGMRVMLRSGAGANFTLVATFDGSYSNSSARELMTILGPTTVWFQVGPIAISIEIEIPLIFTQRVESRADGFLAVARLAAGFDLRFGAEMQNGKFEMVNKLDQHFEKSFAVEGTLTAATTVSIGVEARVAVGVYGIPIVKFSVGLMPYVKASFKSSPETCSANFTIGAEMPLALFSNEFGRPNFEFLNLPTLDCKPLLPMLGWKKSSGQSNSPKIKEAVPADPKVAAATAQQKRAAEVERDWRRKYNDALAALRTARTNNGTAWSLFEAKKKAVLLAKQKLGAAQTAASAAAAALKAASNDQRNAATAWQADKAAVAKLNKELGAANATLARRRTELHEKKRLQTAANETVAKASADTELALSSFIIRNATLVSALQAVTKANASLADAAKRRGSADSSLRKAKEEKNKKPKGNARLLATQDDEGEADASDQESGSGNTGAGDSQTSHDSLWHIAHDPMSCPHSQCSNNGVCMNQRCACDEGWDGPDCSIIEETVIAHQCENECLTLQESDVSFCRHLVGERVCVPRDQTQMLDVLAFERANQTITSYSCFFRQLEVQCAILFPKCQEDGEVFAYVIDDCALVEDDCYFANTPHVNSNSLSRCREYGTVPWQLKGRAMVERRWLEKLTGNARHMHTLSGPVPSMGSCALASNISDISVCPHLLNKQVYVYSSIGTISKASQLVEQRVRESSEVGECLLSAFAALCHSFLPVCNEDLTGPAGVCVESCEDVFAQCNQYNPSSVSGYCSTTKVGFASTAPDCHSFRMSDLKEAEGLQATLERVNRDISRRGKNKAIKKSQRTWIWVAIYWLYWQMT